MAEYLVDDFGAHKKCSHILNIHLQDNAMMKAEHDAGMTKIKATLATLQKSVGEMQAQQDSLATKVRKLKK
jgi:hypothetical protein